MSKGGEGIAAMKIDQEMNRCYKADEAIGAEDELRRSRELCWRRGKLFGDFWGSAVVSPGWRKPCGTDTCT